MIIWVIAGLLALATGMRIGWALVNRQSVVTSAMIVALGSLALLAALNWPPLTRLVDTLIGRPDSAVGLAQVALIAAAAGSAVMITSVSTGPSPVSARRRAAAQYGVAAVVAVVSLVLFPAGFDAGWLVPLLYVSLTMGLVAWVGMRLSNPTRRGRALFVFSTGTALLVAATVLLLIRAAGSAPSGAGATTGLLLCGLAVVAAGALLPTLEDWFGSRRELRLIDPLQRELERRHPDVGIGVRPRGPLVFRVAERLSVISDALYLEATTPETAPESSPETSPETSPEPASDPVEQARTVARWIAAGRRGTAPCPGPDWLRQPAGYSDRDWILEIARRYRELDPERSGT